MLTIKEKITRRSTFLKETRAFFDARGFLEADVPICNKGASIDAYIDLFEVVDAGFLHSSPELRMKDLLTMGSGNIYFLGHVFRKEENGSRHSSEFTMLEYYRTNTCESDFLEEVVDYLSLFLGKKKIEVLTYDQAMEVYCPDNISIPNNCTKAEIQHFSFSHYVEPNLGKGCYTIIKNFPAEEASLAKVVNENKKMVAKRYEFFFDGMELANGFYESDCTTSIKKHFVEGNKKRKAMNKKVYPIDELFLKNLHNGLPKNTYGIAIGFDRLLMLHYNQKHIKDVIL